MTRKKNYGKKFALLKKCTFEKMRTFAKNPIFGGREIGG